MKDRSGLQMLSRLQRPSGCIKLVNNVEELQEIHDQMLEMKADITRASELQSDFKMYNGKAEEVMSVFGEVTELDELLGEYPVMKT